MVKEKDLNILTGELLATYKYLLLHGFMHKRITTEAYNRNFETWNAILLSLEARLVLGFDRILEHKQYFGRKFASDNLNNVVKRINNIRKKLIAHIDTSVADREAFLEQNRFYGSEAIELVDALKRRAIALHSALKDGKFGRLDVQALFNNETKTTMDDLDSWLKSFSTPL